MRRLGALAFTSGAGVLAVAGALLLLSAGVGTESGTAATATGGAADARQAASAANPCAKRKRYSIYYATDAAPGPYYAPLKTGAEKGAQDYCLKLTWTQSPARVSVADTLRRMKTGIAAKPDVLVVSMSDPRVADATVREAIKKGIAVINISAKDRRPVHEQPNYMTYIGVLSDYAVGAAAAQAVLAQGKPTLAVAANPSPKTTFMVDRVRGWESAMKAAGVKTDRIDASKGGAKAIQAYLTKHPGADALYATTFGPKGSGAAREALAKIKRAGKVALVGSEYDSADLQAIKAGTQLAATTQQLYVQGYLAAVVSRLFYERGQVPAYISSGPQLINQSNIANVIAMQAKGIR